MSQSRHCLRGVDHLESFRLMNKAEGIVMEMEEGQKRGWNRFAFVTLFIFPSFYVLSVGPAIYLYGLTQSYALKSGIEATYSPLEITYNTCSVVQPALDAYLSLWR